MTKSRTKTDDFCSKGNTKWPDMLVKLYDLPGAAPLISSLKETGIEIRQARPTDKRFVCGMGYVRNFFRWLGQKNARQQSEQFPTHLLYRSGKADRGQFPAQVLMICRPRCWQGLPVTMLSVRECSVLKVYILTTEDACTRQSIASDLSFAP